MPRQHPVIRRGAVCVGLCLAECSFLERASHRSLWAGRSASATHDCYLRVCVGVLGLARGPSKGPALVVCDCAGRRPARSLTVHLLPPVSTAVPSEWANVQRNLAPTFTYPLAVVWSAAGSPVRLCYSMTRASCPHHKPDPPSYPFEGSDQYAHKSASRASSIASPTEMAADQVWLGGASPSLSPALTPPLVPSFPKQAEQVALEGWGRGPRSPLWGVTLEGVSPVSLLGRVWDSWRAAVGGRLGVGGLVKRQRRWHAQGEGGKVGTACTFQATIRRN